jgi:predicted site-specific integrase-resolvase
MSKKTTEREPVTRRGYRVADWCEAFQTSRAQAYKMMNDGRLPFVVIGGRRFIPDTAAEALLETGES